MFISIPLSKTLKKFLSESLAEEEQYFIQTPLRKQIEDILEENRIIDGIAKMITDFIFCYEYCSILKCGRWVLKDNLCEFHYQKHIVDIEKEKIHALHDKNLIVEECIQFMNETFSEKIDPSNVHKFLEELDFKTTMNLSFVESAIFSKFGFDKMDIEYIEFDEGLPDP